MLNYGKILKYGMSKQQVRDLLGEPHAEGGTSRKYPKPMIWKYDIIELTFDTKQDMLVWVVVQAPEYHAFLDLKSNSVKLTSRFTDEEDCETEHH